MRTKPVYTYNGLTVVLSLPSRFDLKHKGLLSANAGVFFNDCLKPDFNRFGCDIRIKEDKSALLPGTKCILLLGEEAMQSWLTKEEVGDNKIGALRGSVFKHSTGIPIICSYYPQDCVDFKNYEDKYNAYRKSNEEGAAPKQDDDEDDAVTEKRRHGFTDWTNYGFWLHADVTRKVKYILKNNGALPPRKYPEPNYIIYPPSEKVISDFRNNKGKHFYFDIETDADLNIQCLAYSFGLPEVVVIPFIDYRYSPAYSCLADIIISLGICLRDNIAVAHNGAGFDFIVLAHKYGLPIGRQVYDTMVAQHRIKPDIEKSLGHCISYWLWEMFHKDEGDVGYSNPQQMQQLMRYCGKDVSTMIMIHQEQLAFAKTIPGMLESIQQGNDSIRPYLITTLQGIRYDPKIIAERVNENDRLMFQYLRFINILIGDKASATLRRKSIKALPSSNQKCCEYFHNMLGYDVVAYGKPTKKGTRNPSLAKGAMYKLRLKYENPVIDFVMAFREIRKETTTELQFTPYYAHNTPTTSCSTGQTTNPNQG